MKAQKLTYSSNEDWFQARRGKIGGSTIAAILGLDKYRTPLQVYYDLTGQSGVSEENKYTIAGHRLEKVVVEYFSDAAGVMIVSGSEADITYVHPKYEYLIGSPDREYVTKDNKDAILECKTTQFEIDTEGELFQKWYCQLQWYLMVTGYDRGAIAWLSRGVDFDYREFDANRNIQEMLLNTAVEFWKQHIVANTPPDPSNASDLLKRYRDATGLVGECDELLYRSITSLAEEKEKLKTQQAKVDALDEYVKLAIGANEEMTYCGTTVATFRFANTQRVDAKALKEKYPQVYEDVLRNTVSRTLRIK